MKTLYDDEIFIFWKWKPLTQFDPKADWCYSCVNLKPGEICEKTEVGIKDISKTKRTDNSATHAPRLLFLSRRKTFSIPEF